MAGGDINFLEKGASIYLTGWGNGNEGVRTSISTRIRREDS